MSISSLGRAATSGKTSAARILARRLKCVTAPLPRRAMNAKSARRSSPVMDNDVSKSTQPATTASRTSRPALQCAISSSEHAQDLHHAKCTCFPPAFNALLKTLEETASTSEGHFAKTEVPKVPVHHIVAMPTASTWRHRIPRILGTLKEIVISEGMTGTTKR